MKKNVVLSVLIIAVIAITTLAGCGGGKDEVEQKVAEVQRGDLTMDVTADGNLDMPHQVGLRFGTPGTVKKIYVEEGQEVRAGTLLAKLDDTEQKIAVASALYDVELAMNELAEKVYPSIMGYPHYYPTSGALLRVEQAQEEIIEGQELLEMGDYKDAAAKLRIARHDLESGYELLEAPITDVEMYPDIARAVQQAEEDRDVLSYDEVEPYPQIPKAMEMIEKDSDNLAAIQGMIERGEYGEAVAALEGVSADVVETHSVTQKACGQIVRLGISYPDASTSLSNLKQMEEELAKLQGLMEDGECDTVEFAETLRLAQHDLEMSEEILENNELIFRHGLNLKVLRQYNLNLQAAEIALQNYKEQLMKTEILAPFDGTVVDVGVKIDDQLSAYDYSSIVAINLVDTRTVKMEGVVDEIDIFKVKMGQEAVVTVDALPGEEFTGTVTFISPFGSELTGVVNYPVTIELDPTDVELKGGLTATADIIVAKRENVLLVPSNAITRKRGDYWVDVITNEETMETEERPITIGERNEMYTEVISGLTEGQLVLVNSS
jgi:RND family efflux transporter MFP subunit